MGNFGVILDCAAIMKRVLGFLDWKDVLRLGQCSVVCREYCDNDKLWEELVRRNFSEVSDDARSQGITWKGTFRFLSIGQVEYAPHHMDSMLVNIKLSEAIALMMADLGEEKGQQSLATLFQFVSVYPTVRLASPKLAAMKEHGVKVLKACGMVDSGKGYMHCPTSNKALMKKSRDQLELELKKLENRKNASTASLVGKLLASPRGYALKVNESRFVVGHCDSIGRRDNMEDDMACEDDLFGVFDGHAGLVTAKMCAIKMYPVFCSAFTMADNWEEVATIAFKQLHQYVLDFNLKSGCTAVVARVTPKKIFTAHAGDSRALLVREDKVIRMTEDHKPNRLTERKRITAAGGKVSRSFFSSVYRIHGELAISRAIGDEEYEKWGLTHDPECGEFVRSDKDLFLVLACDGVFDVLSDKAVADVVKNYGDDVNVAAKNVVDLAYRKNSGDNLSCLVVDLRTEKETSKVDSTEEDRLDYL